MEGHLEAVEGKHEAEVTIPKLKVLILNSELKMKVVKSFIMLAHHQFNLLFPPSKERLKGRKKKVRTLDLLL